MGTRELLSECYFPTSSTFTTSPISPKSIRHASVSAKYHPLWRCPLKGCRRRSWHENRSSAGRSSNNNDCPKNLRSPLANFIMIFLSSLPSICAGLMALMNSIALAMRSLSSGIDASVLARVGSSTPARCPQAWSRPAPAAPAETCPERAASSKARPRLGESPRALFLLRGAAAVGSS